MIGFIAPYTFKQFGTTGNYSAIAFPHNFQFTVANAIGFSVFTRHPGNGFITTLDYCCIPPATLFLLLYTPSRLKVKVTLRLTVSLLAVPSYNSSVRTPRKTPIVKNACLLVRYLSIDILLLRVLVLRESVYRPIAWQWIYMPQYLLHIDFAG
jgi:hypothetical protein